jgi:hypothetical protein
MLLLPLPEIKREWYVCMYMYDSTINSTSDTLDFVPLLFHVISANNGVSAINHLVAFYDIHARKREVLFFYSVPDTTRDDCT